jgi:hypothetical protein
MLLAVAGLTENAVKECTGKLASGDWSTFPPAQQLGLQLAYKLSRDPGAVSDTDVKTLVDTFGRHRALDIVWYISWCNYMTRIADAFQLQLEMENVFAKK